MRRLDRKIIELGFIKVKEDKYGISYVRYHAGYCQVVDLMRKQSGRHLIQSYDKELDDLMKDIAKLTHDLEWYDSGDYEPDGYFDTVKEFKKKWFQGVRKDRLRKLIDESVDELRKELYGMVGECLTQ